MRLRLVAAGTRMPAWVGDGFDEYARRLPRECALTLTEVALSRARDAARRKDEEAGRMLASARPGDAVIALDVAGRQLDSAGLARKMEGWFARGGDAVFFVGGPDGLGDACLDRADLAWSLSRLTLPHGLVRIVLAEQLYRAHSILRGHPYHRA